MIVKSVEFSNFRNYDHLQLHFDEGTNILYGDNAQGKTNILEGVYLSGTTKSHKGSKDKEMIQFEKEESHIRSIVMKKSTRLICIFEEMEQREWLSIRCQSKRPVSYLEF